MVDKEAHMRNMARDAGYGAAALRERTPFEHIHDPALRYVAYMMSKGDESAVRSFAHGMRDRFHDEGTELTASHAADLMTRSTWIAGKRVTDTGYMPSWWTESRKELLSKELRDLITENPSPQRKAR